MLGGANATAKHSAAKHHSVRFMRAGEGGGEESMERGKERAVMAKQCGDGNR